MYPLLISLLFAGACSYASYVNELGPGTVSGYGIAAFLLSMFLTGSIVRRKVSGVQEELQAIMTRGQNRINRKVQQFQSRPGGNPTQIQRELEAEQKNMITQALEFLPKLEPFKKWNLLMARQIDTMRLQFLYQLRDMEAVDRLLARRSPFSGPLFSEPILVGMKMARQYENKEFAAAEKSFKKHIKWFRKDRGSLLYALMAWIYVKNGQNDEARKLLLKGKEVTGNSVLARNWEQLANDNPKKFSNAGLGEEWFGLYLEKPPAPKQKRMRGNPRGHAMF
ncbi:MAG: hypothetical protein ACO3NW_00985 [Kiritimatiellia bacterium]